MTHATKADINAPAAHDTGLSPQLVRTMLEQVNKVNLPAFNVDATILRGLLMELLRFSAAEKQNEKEKIAFVQHMTLEFGYHAAADMVKVLIENGDAQAKSGDIDARSMLVYLEREFRSAAEENSVKTWAAA